jgi:hypothetical protein
MEDIMEQFTTAYSQVTHGVKYKIYKLPNGVIHRGKDQPAIVYEDGALVYMQMGIIHRDNDLPAVITKDAPIGANTGLPELVDADHPRGIHTLIQNGHIWYKRGMIHRDNDLPAGIDDEYKHWYFEGKRHREGDKPATVSVNGYCAWWQHYKRHRDNDLPARTWTDGGASEWYINGEQYVPEV